MNFPVQRPGSAASAARWCVVAIVLVALLVGSLLPGNVVLLPFEIHPPVKHLVVYGLLGVLLVLALKADWKQALVVGIALTVLGFLFEVAQIPIPDRSFMWIDAGASAIGAVLGAVFGLFVRWFVR